MIEIFLKGWFAKSYGQFSLYKDSLELMRRCDALSCEGHCPQDQKCPYSQTLGSCIDKSDRKYITIVYTALCLCNI